MSIVDSCTCYEDQITVSESVLNMLQKNLRLATTVVDIHQGFGYCAIDTFALIHASLSCTKGFLFAPQKIKWAVSNLA